MIVGVPEAAARDLVAPPAGWRRRARRPGPIRCVAVACLLLGACGTDARRVAPPSFGLAKPDCTPGTFAGSMTVNCPNR